MDCRKASAFLCELIYCMLWSYIARCSLAQESYDLHFSTVARGSVVVDLPRVIGGADGEVLKATVDTSRLKYGTLVQVVDWTYEYTTTYELVDPLGCTDLAIYTLSDGKGFSTSAQIIIDIAANEPPYAEFSGRTSVNRPVVINITKVGSDSDGDIVRLVKVGTPRYGTVSVDGDIITYTPLRDLVNPQTGAMDAFSFQITDGRGGTSQSLIEVSIEANRPPYVSNWYDLPVHHNRSVLIDLQLQGVNETTLLISDEDADPNITGVVDFSGAKLGSAKQLGPGLYQYNAYPGVSDEHQRETFTITANDGRGGVGTGELTVLILANNAPYVTSKQSVATLSTQPVVVAPLVSVQDYDEGDDEALLLLNISQPRFGTLELLSCCNSVKDYYYGTRQVADYRYTPGPNITTTQVENLTYTVTDQKGGFATGQISITIWPSPKCEGDLYGETVPGFLADVEVYYGSSIPECGGVFSWTNCFNEVRTEARNAACIQADWFSTNDVYDTDSPYNGTASYVCLLPSRRKPCSPKSDPKAKGLTMWQNLATVPCSAECDWVTREFTVPKNSRVTSPSDCDVCIDCKDECGETPSGRALGPEICCVGAPEALGIISNNTNSTNSTGLTPCSECIKQPAAPVCGSDGNTYVTACLANCQGVNVSAQGVCAGTPDMLDLSKVPDMTSAEAMQMMKDGFKVVGMAQTTDAPDDDDGFVVPVTAAADAGLVSAAAANKWLVPKLHHFQVLYVSIYSKNTTALLGGRKQQEVRKIYNAHRQTAKISRVVEPDVPGSRATCSLVGRMEYPYQAIGMVAKVNASGPFGFCTGWMIRHNLVVTAAHCVYNSTKRRPSWPGHLRFLPQVYGGKPNGKLHGMQGYRVRALAIPGWFEQLSNTPHKRQDTYMFDMALLYLDEAVVPCNQCLLHPAIAVGAVGWLSYDDDLQMAGYGKPANRNLQLNASAPCSVSLKPNKAYALNKCSSTKGHSGSPYWTAAGRGLPQGVLPYTWPVLGVHQGSTPTGNNAVMMQFTPAHLKWLYWAGAGNKVLYLACSGSDITGSTNCARYKYAGQ